MLMNFIKLVFMVVVLVIFVLVNQAGWIVDLQRARDARNNLLEGQVASHGPFGLWSVFDVDFRTQPDPTDKSIDRETRFWPDYVPFYAAQSEEDVNWRTKAFLTTWIKWGGDPCEGIPTA